MGHFFIQTTSNVQKLRIQRQEWEQLRNTNIISIENCFKLLEEKRQQKERLDRGPRSHGRNQQLTQYEDEIYTLAKSILGFESLLEEIEQNIEKINNKISELEKTRAAPTLNYHRLNQPAA